MTSYLVTYGPYREDEEGDTPEEAALAFASRHANPDNNSVQTMTIKVCWNDIGSNYECRSYEVEARIETRIGKKLHD